MPVTRWQSVATSDLFLGIDVGTGGVRVLAVDETGHVASRQSVPLESSQLTQRETIHEQPPEAWWWAVCQALSALMVDLRVQAIPPESLKALAVDGTSGTLVCLDAAGKPVRPAIMYNDGRATDEAVRINAIAEAFCDKLGYRFAASYALAKILWVRNHEPENFERTRYFAHQADFILSRLTGEFGISDYSNALKTGYDLIDERWPDWIEDIVGMPDRLPRIVAPGTVVGRVTPTASDQTGLPPGLPVATGATDGTAACLASGVKRPGDYNTTLGTTLVFKAISQKPCKHPDGIIYSHKLPGGLWLPGAASNTGAEWITVLFPQAAVDTMDASASRKLPTSVLAYPLARKGERFPFLSPTAEGFCIPEPENGVTRYAACLQGTALLERLSYQILDEVSGSSGGEVFSTGGGSHSDAWMQCRADATSRVIHRPACPESAFGSAILAAAGLHDSSPWEAVNRMVRIEKTFTPRPDLMPQYNDLYGRFRSELEKRGYL